MTHEQPYGTWKSPITARFLTSAGVGLSEVKHEGGRLYWLESRPAEAGRVVIVKATLDGERSDAIPSGFNARSRVHEYGGGAYGVAGETVFFSNFKDQRLYRQEPGGTPQPITPEPEIPAGLRYADLVVTPANTIVCVRERHLAGRQAINEIVTLPADGSAQPRIILSGYDFYSFPRLSPDGLRIAWTCWNHPQMPWDGTELWTAEFDATSGGIINKRLVAGSPTESIFQPAWSPEGALHFISDRSGWWNLYRDNAGAVESLAPMDAEFGVPQWVFGYSRYDFLSGGRIACIYSRSGLDFLAVIDTGKGGMENFASPYTTIGDVCCDGGRSIFIIGSSAARASEIVAIDLDGRSQVVHRSQESRLDEGYISRPEPIEFPTSNGRTAFALFYPPRNRDFTAPSGERPPLIVISHGGPTSAATSSLKLGIQFWTSRGFGVVDVNYGGSTGYGREYRERLRGQWGIVDVEDCINAARFLERRGDVDPRRMVIRGGSAGGYTTLCALVFHKVFAAGASYYGVADIEVLQSDTHKFESQYEQGLIGPEHFYERSPVHFADRLSCPVILFQGLEDKVVPPTQAETMIAALRAKRIPFAYVAFPTEGHGFREAANIERAAEAELYFYSKVFGFSPADRIEPVSIEGPLP